MNSISVKWQPRNMLLMILILQFVVYALVFFDIPVARQVIGFVYFTFLPGFVVIKLLKLDKLEGLETALFSVGLSVAFLMLAGLLINEFCFLCGISEPLSVTLLIIVLNNLVLIGGLLAFLKDKNIKFWKGKTIGATTLAVFPMILPVLSVVGAMWVDVYGNNTILLIMIMAITLVFVAGIISKKALPPRLYPLTVFMIAISLLYHSSLISKNLMAYGSDIENEYSAFQTTRSNAYWSSIPISASRAYGRMNSMLSITILPTIYSTLLNMNGTQVFKILYPLIFSFVPLILYQLWQKNFGKKRAFAAGFLLMAQATFYREMFGLNREMVAELFFSLLLLTILNKKMKPLSRNICFMVFSVALVTSHYGLAEIFLFLISIACIYLVLMKRQSRNLTVAMVVFFFVVMFVWYIYTSNSATFDSFLSFGNYVSDQLDQFFNPASRGQTVMRGLGLEESPSVWNTFSRIFWYLTEFLIALGFLGLIIRRIDIRLEKEHFALTVIAAAFLLMLIAVPGLATTMNMSRFYHILLFFLAPLCVLGAEFLARLLSKRKKKLAASVLLLTALTPYFLFQTGLVYELTGSESWSAALSSYRMDALKLYGWLGLIDDWSALACQWLHKSVHIQHAQVYADLSSTIGLVIYGSLYRDDIILLSNTTEVSANGTIFLNPLNVIYKKIVTHHYIYTSDEISFLEDMNKIYTNGGGEIYRNSFEN